MKLESFIGLLARVEGSPASVPFSTVITCIKFGDAFGSSREATLALRRILEAPEPGEAIVPPAPALALNPQTENLIFRALTQANADLQGSAEAMDLNPDAAHASGLWELHDAAEELTKAVEEIARMLRKSARPDMISAAEAVALGNQLDAKEGA